LFALAWCGAFAEEDERGSRGTVLINNSSPIEASLSVVILACLES